MSETLPKLYILRRKRGGFGGAEKVMLRFVESLRERWQIEVVTEGAVINGFAVGALKGPNWWRARQYARRVDELLTQQPADLVFSMERGSFCHAYRAGDGVHRRWIELRYGRSLKWCFNPWHWIAPRLEQKTFQQARVLIANSQMVQEDIGRFYPSLKEKVRVVYNGFDPAIYHLSQEARTSLRRSLRLPETGKMLLFCGSGWERKGLRSSLQFLAKVRNLSPEEPTHLVVLGKGKAERYASLIASLGLEGGVTFVPPQENVAPYYQAADAMILPTAYDPFSNACLEALACGCPVITTLQNGVAEKIESGRTGLILPDVSEESIRAVAEQWLRFHPDAAVIADSVRGLSKENELAQLQAVFKEIGPADV